MTKGQQVAVGLCAWGCVLAARNFGDGWNQFGLWVAAMSAAIWLGTIDWGE